jgi:adenylate kinase family enzyme
MQQQLGPLHDVVDYYGERGILTAVNGLQPIEDVTTALLDALGWAVAEDR